MDVLVLDQLRSRSMPGSPGDPTAERPRGRRWPFGRLTGTAPGGSASGATAARRNSLYSYTAASIVLGLGLLAWTSVVNPPLPAIDPQLAPGTVLSGPTGGLLLWLVYGLLGSLRVLRAPGGATMTFHLPFVGAAMILGGPTAGAWVAFLSSIERRELESQPWYGILSNHATLVIAAVMGGLATQLTAGLLGSDGNGASALAAAVVGALVLTGVATSMAVVTILLREDISARAFLEILLGQVGRITAVECALVVVLATTYSGLGWWAPLLVGGFVLLVWDNHPMPAPDPLTRILNAEGFGRRLDSGLGRLRRGVTPGATLLSIDLDLFKTVNDRYGHAVGDEVLRGVGTRLAAQARRPHDLAGRLGGDEFALFLPGLTETDVAMRRADDVVAAISAPIATSVGPVSVGASVGVLVLESWGGVPSSGTVLRHADQAMYHAKRDGGRIHLYDGREAAPFDGALLESRR
ncbi:MAG TPA: GGDEF domain-containing protein [Candidatus Limnocylindrales bacterium]|nr:GGDEF domain-containing protein [Candidatus Limnocylindrales bacterium]